MSIELPDLTSLSPATMLGVLTLLVVLAGRLRRLGRHMSRMLPGRRYRDPQRFFSSAQRHELARRAGGRCEHKPLLWHRCDRTGRHADHVIPWSKGGPTTLDNGQWLCARHNLRKSDTMPSPLYRWRLTRRREHY